MKLQDPITNAQIMSRSILRSNVAEESRNNGHLWQKFVSERLRFTSSVAEFMAATWTTAAGGTRAPGKVQQEQRWGPKKK